MARKKTTQFNLDFAFFTYLRFFFIENRRQIRSQFQDLSKKFLDFNDPESGAFLWEPQFEALEMYIFLKEYLDNRHVHQIFADWHAKQKGFEIRSSLGVEQLDLFGNLDTIQYEAIFEYIRKFDKRSYPNYIFALPMGTGKTTLMTTCIFYEFLLANKFPKDPKYCHNALVTTPDRTVLRSILKDIQSLDIGRVVPPEYVNFLSNHIQFHFLEEAGTTLSTLDRSRFNLIISNTQKLILKRQHAEKSATDNLFQSGTPNYQPESVYDKAADLYNFDAPEDEKDLTTNQRFQKLTRLEQLGIFVDEAHHAFGRDLEKDMGMRKLKTSLRLTIDELAANLERAGTRVCACYNFTGTPYVEQRVLPEVVYSYGLKEAIDKGFLKKVMLHSYTNPRTLDFVKVVIRHFWETHEEQRHEGMLPKLALFAATIDELQNELRPAVEAALSELHVPLSRILVNVGDDKLTSNDDKRRFDNLDTPASEDQFILLVNKGREGWNCRSLFGVALYRTPESKIFVLQASMRCLRQIGEGQQTGHVYLSDENTQILDDELKQNFRLTIDEIRNVGAEKIDYKVRVKKSVKITLKHIRRMHRLVEKQLQRGLCLELNKADTEKYRLRHTRREGLSDSSTVQTEDLTEFKERREFSQLTLCAEIARYLNRSPLEIEDILIDTQEGLEEILRKVNEFNELLYDWIIPHLFNALYDLEEFKHEEEKEIELVKEPENGYYPVRANPDLVVKDDEQAVRNYEHKSFHLDTYAFDSTPEKSLFLSTLGNGKVREVYFTGMLTHGQSDFYIQYIDPESHAVRRYYPDFLMQKEDGSWVIVEVKGDHLIEDQLVQVKAEATQQVTYVSDMSYGIIKESEVSAGGYGWLLE